MWKLFCILSTILIAFEITAFIYIATCPAEQIVHLGFVIPKPILMAGIYALYVIIYDKTLLICFAICLIAFYASIVYEEKQTEKYIADLQKTQPYQIRK